jgi:NADH-quinone oxidoreductase subunit E
VNLECQHCGYIWDYRGGNRFYATCPQCRYKVKVPEGAKMNPRTTIMAEPTGGSVKLKGVAKIVERILSKHGYEKRYLIQVLLSIQRSYGWLPMEMLSEVSRQLEVPYGQVYQIATFYKAFSMNPRGKHHVRVCNGTSCKVRGAQAVIEGMERKLKIGIEETTNDGRFSLETVNCVGCCAMGPMMTVDGEYFGNIDLNELDRILEKFR